MNQTQIKNFLKGMNDNQNLGLTQRKNSAYLKGYDTYGYYRLIHSRGYPALLAARRAAA